jgi:hypothetical protein
MPPDSPFERLLAYPTLERVLIGSLTLPPFGLVLAVVTVVGWGMTSFQGLYRARSMRVVFPAVTVMLIAVQSAIGAMIDALARACRLGGRVVFEWTDPGQLVRKSFR